MNGRITVIVAGIVLLLAGGLGAQRLLHGEREVTTTSKAAYEYYRDGLHSLRSFRLEEALDYFEKAIGHDPSFAMAHLQLAILARDVGRKEQFAKELDEAYALRDQVSEIERLRIERTKALLDEDRDTAEKLYSEMLEKYPDHPYTLRLKAEIAKMDQDFDTALQCYDEILRRDPEAVDMYNLRGYLYLSSGEYEKAIQSLQRYAFYAPDQANPHDSLGEAYLYTGRYEDAIREFARSLEIDPSFVWSAKNLAHALMITGQFRRAREVLDKTHPVFVQRHWEDWYTSEEMRVEYAAEQWEELRTEATAQLPLSEEQTKNLEFAIWVHYASTIASLELGDIEAAKKSRDRLVELIESVKKKAPASEALDQIIDVNRAYIISRFARAEGEPQRGIEALSKALAETNLSPHQVAEFREELVRDLLLVGENEDAVKQAQILLKDIPTYPEINLLVAKAYLRLQDRQRALEHLKTYHEVMRYADEGHPRVAEAQRLLQRLVPRS